MRRGLNVVFRDVILLALLGFVTITVLLVYHLNPPKTEEGIPPPGSLTVSISWPQGWRTDVDLWVQAPGDVPVGYSNKGGRVFNLLRDDLGMLGDDTDSNFEFAFTRGLPDGDYTVNAHLYRHLEKLFPVPVKAGVQLAVAGNIKTILRGRGDLWKMGEEITLFRFRLLDGEVVDSHHIFRPLRVPQ